MEQMTIEEYISLRKEVEDMERKLAEAKERCDKADLHFSYNDEHSLIGKCFKGDVSHIMVIKQHQGMVHIIEVLDRRNPLGETICSVSFHWTRTEGVIKHFEVETADEFLSRYSRVKETLNDEVTNTLSQNTEE